MADSKYKDSSQGALFINNRRKTDAHPNFRGELTITKTLLKDLVEKVKAGGEAKLALSAWDRKSKAGNRYISVAAQMYVDYKKEETSEEEPF